MQETSLVPVEAVTRYWETTTMGESTFISGNLDELNGVCAYVILLRFFLELPYGLLDEAVVLQRVEVFVHGVP